MPPRRFAEVSPSGGHARHAGGKFATAYIQHAFSGQLSLDELLTMTFEKTLAHYSAGAYQPLYCRKESTRRFIPLLPLFLKVPRR